jgi:hypothetical protein
MDRKETAGPFASVGMTTCGRTGRETTVERGGSLRDSGELFLKFDIF